MISPGSHRLAESTPESIARPILPHPTKPILCMRPTLKEEVRTRIAEPSRPRRRHRTVAQSRMENALEAIHPQMLQTIPKTFFRIVLGMVCGITRKSRRRRYRAKARGRPRKAGLSIKPRESVQQPASCGKGRPASKRRRARRQYPGPSEQPRSRPRAGPASPPP